MWPLSEDTNEVALLCAWFAGEHHPLALHEYNRLASWLNQQELRPRNLIDSCCLEEASKSTDLNLERLTGLLNRRISMGFYLEEWKRRGIWMIGRGDEDYPVRIRTHLRSHAPPILYGMGEISLLNRGGTAIVGPNPLALDCYESLSRIGRLCIEHQSTIISAGKLPPATQAIEIAIQYSGAFIWLLQGSLLAEPLTKQYRDIKSSGKRVLLSTRSPADPRLFSGEPELGQLIVTLCDSIIYLDGTDLSMDWLHIGEVFKPSLPQKKCFVWTGNYATSLAEHLIQCGAEPWINDEDAMDTGLFENQESISLSESESNAKGADDSKVTSESEQNTHSEENLDHSEADIPSSDMEGEFYGIDAPSQFLKEIARSNGIQGELFDLKVEPN